MAPAGKLFLEMNFTIQCRNVINEHLHMSMRDRRHSDCRSLTVKLHSVSKFSSHRVPIFGILSAEFHHSVCELTVSNSALRLQAIGTQNATLSCNFDRL